MRIERRTGADERQILTGMILHPGVLGPIAAHWPRPGGACASDWANRVGGWCVRHWDRYGEPPGRSIETAFGQWAENGADRATAELVERFLSTLSDEYEAGGREVNPEYTLDVASRYFERVRLERLAAQIQEDLAAGMAPDEIKARAEALPQTALGASVGIDPFFDEAAIDAAYAESQDTLIAWPTMLEGFFGSAFTRDSFIAFMGPEKRGKSWWLMEVAWHALLSRRRVAVFEVGDMSQNQVLRRLMVRAAKRPMGPGKVLVPRSISRESGDQLATVVHATKEFEGHLHAEAAKAALREVMRRKVRSKESYFKLVTRPNNTVNVGIIRNTLDGWARMGWVADVVVIDYADIMAPPPGTQDPRERINETWKGLRALSQEFHCCLVTATQTDADSYNAGLINRRHFSEDKRKYGHVTGMIGINVTDAEKDLGLTRLNWVQRREDEFSVRRCIHVAGCLGLSSPAIKACY